MKDTLETSIGPFKVEWGVRFEPGKATTALDVVGSAARWGGLAELLLGQALHHVPA
jgi:hypothetical protein